MIPPPPAERLLLASSSPRRAKILRALGVPFETVPAPCEEILDPADPVGTVSENARRKHAAAVAAHPGAWLLAADTVVAVDGRVLGKPRDREDAAAMLLSYSGRVQNVFTGVALSAPGAAEPDVRVCSSSVRFRDLSRETVEAYLDAARPYDRAGAYDIDDRGAWLVASLTGSFTNVMGLPEELVRDWLLARGWRAD